MPEETKPVAEINFVTRPAEGAYPEAQIKMSTIAHLIPVMWERSVKRIATLAGAKIIRGDYFIIVQFPKGTSVDEMRQVVTNVMTQAQALTDQREEARAKRAAAKRASSESLVMDGPDRHPKSKTKTSRMGDNVPVRVAPQRRR